MDVVDLRNAIRIQVKHLNGSIYQLNALMRGRSS